MALPSFSTAILPAPCKRPWPSNTVTLCFFKRNLTPFDSWLATARLRPMDFLEIEFDVLGGKAELVQAVQQMMDLRCAQQRLWWVCNPS